MTGLIAQDLDILGRELPQTGAKFAMPQGADPVGLAWVLAGSHLGNRMMLKGVREKAPGWPVNFLADESMGRFWKDLRAQLDTPVTLASAHSATIAARAVFDHFIAVFDRFPTSRIAA